jgi:hypothetical protein
MMLGAIRRVTISCNNLEAMEHAYGEYLGYQVSSRGAITQTEADAWGAPAMAGAANLSMQPAVGNDFEFRFVAGATYPDYVPLTTYGWNASEIMVENVDAMAERVANSPFKIVGEPRNLSFSDDIRAMQLCGPANEIVYLTEFKNPVPGLSVPTPRSPVDRTFIVILGGGSMHELQDFYHNTFGIARTPIVESRVTMLSKALNVSIETLYPIAALTLEGDSLLEVDEMPVSVGPRACSDGYLPPGIASVGFDCKAIPESAVQFAEGIKVMRGTTGELIELHSI